MAINPINLPDNYIELDEIKRKIPRKARTTPLSRKDIQQTLTRIVNYFREESVNGRVRNAEMEKHRRESARIAIYACSVFLTALKDDQMDEIEKRLELLENK